MQEPEVHEAEQQQEEAPHHEESKPVVTLRGPHGQSNWGGRYTIHCVLLIYFLCFSLLCPAQKPRENPSTLK